jgi:pimeloyl-ACP methyl ester carboxylesterase
MDSAIAHLQDPIDPDSAFMREWWNVPDVDPVLLAILRRESAAIPADIWRAMLDQLASSNDLRFTMSRIKAPTLLVFGGKDSLFGAETQEALKAQLPDAKVVLFPDLGHSLPEQDPAAVAAAIREFLAH